MKGRDMRHLWVRTGLVFTLVLVSVLSLSGMARAVLPNKAVSLPDDRDNVLQFRSGGHVLGFAPQKVYMVGLGYALIEEFMGASGEPPLAAPSTDKEPARESGGREKGAPCFQGVSYPEIWKGITVRYDRVSGGLAESLYLVDPGADPEKIRVRYNMDFEIREDGELWFRQASNRGYFTLSRPRAWQEIGGRKVSVDVAFKKFGERTVGFVVGSRDSGHPLMIDPTYQWHAFYGSGTDDTGSNIAVTEDGVYVVGDSTATWDVDGKGPLHAFSGFNDMVVLKLDTDGNYQWHTFYGSGNIDYGVGIAATVDGVYVTGESYVTWNVDGMEPLHPHSGGDDIAVFKLDTDGTYQWHAFYGSNLDDAGLRIAVAGDGVYVAGLSKATWDFGGTGPKHPHMGNSDIVILKLNTGGAYQWHTFYGSGDYDSSSGIAVMGDAIYVTGDSYATWNAGSTEPLHAYTGSNDIVVLKLDTDGNYGWHTFYGSAGADRGRGIFVTGDEVYVVGYSNASWNADGTEPLHPCNGSGSYDIVVLGLGADGSYRWHTFYGSDAIDFGRGIVVSGGAVYVTGYSYASWNADGTEPLHPYSGSSDIMILKLDTDGTYQWHTFYGSETKSDTGHGIAAMLDGLYVTGIGEASWNVNGTEPLHAHSGGSDIAVLKLTDPAPPTLTTAEASSITGNTASCGGNVTFDGGSEVTARGVCWNTTGSPDIGNDDKTDDGAGTGEFVSSLTGLSTETRYYVRAYATNAIGTSYGNEVDFTTGYDEDGVDSEEENGVPTPGGGTGDGNGDGIPDKDQPDVASLKTYDQQDYATLDATANGGTSLKNVTTQSPAEAGVPDYIYMPFGVFHYEIHGVAAGEEVTMEILVPYDPSITGYFKWNRYTRSWMNVAVEVDHTSVPGKTRIVFVLKEGGPYDTDGNPTTITDPGGPGRYAEPKPAVTQVSSLSPVGMIFLSILTAFFGVFLLRTKESA